MALEGKTAIVTRAGRGIGRAIAIAYARAGITVVCCARNSDQINQTIGLIESEGGRAFAVTADVTDKEAVVDVVQTAINRTGRVDVCFNNAATNRSLGYLWRSMEADFVGESAVHLLTIASADNNGKLYNAPGREFAD